MLLSSLSQQKCDPDPDIIGMTVDSRFVQKGYLFAALFGDKVDGVDYIPQAEQKQASALLTRHGVKANIPVIYADEPRQKLAQMASRFYADKPSFLAGITGTNGKTSTANFAAQIWAKLGYGGGSLGTLGVQVRRDEQELYAQPLTHTTPEPIMLHQQIQAATKAGCDYLAMEVSSHALVQYRADGLRYDVAAFTNITQDHLDFHETFQDYFEAKKRLFRALLKPDGLAIINVNGAGSHDLIGFLNSQNIKTFTTGQGATDLKLEKLEPTPNGLELCLSFEGTYYDVSVPLVGLFQAENILLAVAIVMVSGASLDDIVSLLPSLEGVLGRMQLVNSYNGAGIYVDYAHTPDAVATALSAARPHVKGRLIVILGAGGDRDAAKRPLMGEAARRGADHVIITDDNPRSEDPALIRDAILATVPDADNIGDRAKAIAHGVAMVEAGDILMILGKGHETGQMIGDRVVPFNDCEEVEKLIGYS